MRRATKRKSMASKKKMIHKRGLKSKSKRSASKGKVILSKKRGSTKLLLSRKKISSSKSRGKMGGTMRKSTARTMSKGRRQTSWR